MRGNKWRGLDVGDVRREESRKLRGKVQGFARVLRELVAEPKLRPDQGLFTTLCLKCADT